MHDTYSVLINTEVYTFTQIRVNMHTYGVLIPYRVLLHRGSVTKHQQGVVHYLVYTYLVLLNTKLVYFSNYTRLVLWQNEYGVNLYYPQCHHKTLTFSVKR